MQSMGWILGKKLLHWPCLSFHVCRIHLLQYFDDSRSWASHDISLHSNRCHILVATITQKWPCFSLRSCLVQECPGITLRWFSLPLCASAIVSEVLQKDRSSAFPNIQKTPTLIAGCAHFFTPQNWRMDYHLNIFKWWALEKHGSLASNVAILGGYLCWISRA